MERRQGGRPRSEEARQAIMDATEGLLRERGYAGLSIDEVARRAGVSKRTIYRWWSSKGSLVAEAFTETAAERHQDIDTGRVRDDLTGYLQVLFADVANPGKTAALRSMMAEAQADPGFAADFAAFIAGRRDLLRAMLRRGIDRGEIRAEADLDVAVDFVFGLYWYRMLTGHLPLDQALAQRITDELLDGLARPLEPPGNSGTRCAKPRIGPMKTDTPGTCQRRGWGRRQSRDRSDRPRAARQRACSRPAGPANIPPHRKR
jgi:AcrR family transcriptional regulator